MKKQKIRFMLDIGSWVEYGGEYYYGNLITEELGRLLCTKFESDEKIIDTINYFKDKRKFISKLIDKRIKPFLNKETADELAKERLLKSYPKATDDMIGQFQLDAFAGCYVKDKVMEDLVILYTQMQNYNDYICNKFLEEC
ncbi:hypothetical protein [Clostridium botulinum]|uniref:hypothetical protein n=1 Tax=Clostridium botulinum TaxID=1491 RepID=UPI001C9B599C|nr:hypothetical protein [Clostridium botulinum]MBY6838751.1 hypothetical protein [Clostridium botulinum]